MDYLMHSFEIGSTIERGNKQILNFIIFTVLYVSTYISTYINYLFGLLQVNCHYLRRCSKNPFRPSLLSGKGYQDRACRLSKQQKMDNS